VIRFSATDFLLERKKTG